MIDPELVKFKLFDISFVAKYGLVDARRWTALCLQPMFPKIVNIINHHLHHIELHLIDIFSGALRDTLYRIPMRVLAPADNVILFSCLTSVFAKEYTLNCIGIFLLKFD